MVSVSGPESTRHYGSLGKCDQRGQAGEYEYGAGGHATGCALEHGDFGGVHGGVLRIADTVAREVEADLDAECQLLRGSARGDGTFDIA
jgi:hypothetical protein